MTLFSQRLQTNLRIILDTTLYNPSADVLLFVRASNAEIYAMRLSYVAL